MTLAGPPLYGAEPCALSGRVFAGRYQVLGALARGGMAEVYLARQTGMEGFEKLVALKCIADRHAGDEYFLAMFLDEARTAADLRHPNIVQTLEVGVDQERAFIAMEFLHGASLSRVLKALARDGGAVPVDVALHVAREAAIGLHAAHTKADLQGRPRGIVHRDVSPQNIFLTVDGVAKIVDFGIAKAHDRSIETTAGGLKGKLPYMSPEQLEGEDIDARADQFALGVVLWEMVVGRQLFRRDTEAKTMDAVRACVLPPPSTLRSVPPALDGVLARALAKSREQRFPDCAAFAAALERLEEGLGVAVRPSRVAAFLHQALDDDTKPGTPATLGAPPDQSATPRASGPSSVDPSAPTLTHGSRLSATEAAAVRRRAPLVAAAATALVGALLGVVLLWPDAAPAGGQGDRRAALDGTDAGADTASAPLDAASTPAAAVAPVVPDAGLEVAASADAGEPRRTDARPVRPKKTHAPPDQETPAAVAPAGEGTLWFKDVDPYYVAVVDGVAIGPTPRRHRVGAGAHRVELRAPETNAVVLTREVDVPAGSTLPIAAR
ncbi:MAG: hypothetical protein A2138_07035 [Deltaproteobacteria bacterium RBG_16_71_12]|nr:MAG: hypothetical protein A2138_07035 [Deltaproteobacteria bacterium RBG_16_71_12]